MHMNHSIPSLTEKCSLYTSMGYSNVQCWSSILPIEQAHLLVTLSSRFFLTYSSQKDCNIKKNQKRKKDVFCYILWHASCKFVVNCLFLFGLPNFLLSFLFKMIQYVCNQIKCLLLDQGKRCPKRVMEWKIFQLLLLFKP